MKTQSLSRSTLYTVATTLVLAFASGCAADQGDLIELRDDEGVIVSEVRVTDCDGPFNCRLPNGSSANANRYDNPRTGSDHWDIRAGSGLYDGVGNLRGIIRDGSVKINFGQRKVIGGRTFVYAFAVTLNGGTAASGWMLQSAVLDGNIRSMPTVNARNPGQGSYETEWVITGGDVNLYGSLKVKPNVTESHVAASDYLRRTGDVVNVLYSLPGMGGVASDTLPLGVVFHRSHGVQEVNIALYRPAQATVVGHMTFIYGHVSGRFGWIARDALTARSQMPSPPVDPSANPAPMMGANPGEPSGAPVTGNCYVRCCDGSLQGPIATTTAAECRDRVGVCAGHGPARRAEFNGAEAYARPSTCWARCNNREAYHSVVGVTQDCTQHARVYCAQSDRGGLRDAAWSVCAP
jgi:hypothetical protein